MEKEQQNAKQKAERALAGAAAAGTSGRKDEPWLDEGIVVKVSQMKQLFGKLYCI